jgi:twitching motility protein PilT
MFLLDDSLFNHWKNGLVDKEEILLRSKKPQDLATKIALYEKGGQDDGDYEEVDDDEEFEEVDD